MSEASRVLRPLDDAEDAVRMLDAYRSPADLARALHETARAVGQSLRLLLRSDRGAPDELRLVALSPTELPATRLIEVLRRRDLISIELAGMAHELERAAARAASGEIHAADADLARQVVDRLRAEAAGEAAAGAITPDTAAATAAAAAGAVPPTAAGPPRARPRAAPAVDAASAGAGAPRARFRVPPELWPGSRRLRWAAAGIAIAILFAFITVLLRALDDAMDEATAAFAAGRLDEAERRFEAVIEERPDDTTALLYLGRISRIQGDYESAAAYLRVAAREAPDDPDVRRELGHLFRDLNRPRAAEEQYRRALEIEPESEAAWIGLILALQDAGDPRGDELLRNAPPGVRAAFTTREANR